VVMHSSKNHCEGPSESFFSICSRDLAVVYGPFRPRRKALMTTSTNKIIAKATTIIITSVVPNPMIAIDSPPLCKM
jgi:hypothetical protein